MLGKKTKTITGILGSKDVKLRQNRKHSASQTPKNTAIRPKHSGIVEPEQWYLGT